MDYPIASKTKLYLFIQELFSFLSSAAYRNEKRKSQINLIKGE